MVDDRIRCKALLNKVMSSVDAAQLVHDGMMVGASGFTRAGDVKAVPAALAERAQREGKPLRITLVTGASLGHDTDKILTQAGVLARRLPFQVDSTLRRAINDGQVIFVDQHLSETVELLRTNRLGSMDIAIIEAAAITETGGIVPTTSIGNSATFAACAQKVIVELNLAQPAELEGLHDIWLPPDRPLREPLPLLPPPPPPGPPPLLRPPLHIPSAT